MKNSQKGFATIPLIIAIVAVLAIAGGVYFYETKTKSPTDTNVQSQNNPSPNISNPAPVTASSASCGDFAALSDFVLKSIQQPDSKNTMQENKNVITSIRWKRSPNEPFVSYPIVSGIQAYYGNEQVNRSHDFVVSAIKNNSDALDKTINEKVKNLGLSADSLNTLPFQSFSSQDIYLRTLAFRGADNLYSITLKVEGGGHQAPPVGVVTVTCGKAVNQYDKVYNALNFKADASVQDSYDNDYVAIADVSSDKMVYALLGSSNHIKIADYYYFDGTTVKLVSKDSYPAQCVSLESQKVVLGMRCTDQNYHQRTVTYESGTNNNASQTINIISPNGGERLVKGKTFRITWNTSASFNSNYPQVAITLITAKGEQGVKPDQQIITNNTGIFDWTVPSAQLSGYIHDYSGGPYDLRTLNEQTEFQFLIEGYPHTTGRAEGPFDYSNGSFYLISQ